MVVTNNVSYVAGYTAKNMTDDISVAANHSEAGGALSVGGAAICRLSDKQDGWRVPVLNARNQ